MIAYNLTDHSKSNCSEKSTKWLILKHNWWILLWRKSQWRRELFFSVGSWIWINIVRQIMKVGQTYSYYWFWIGQREWSRTTKWLILFKVANQKMSIIKIEPSLLFLLFIICLIEFITLSSNRSWDKKIAKFFWKWFPHLSSVCEIFMVITLISC